MSFDVAAESYDRFMGRFSTQLAAPFADFAGVSSGQRVLDVGCGPGALTTELVERLGVDAVTAIDPSESFVAAARERHPGVTVQLLEDKTIRLLPRLLSGRLDLAFVRPPATRDNRLEFFMLFHETAVVAVPARHKLAKRKRLSLATLADAPLIVSDRRARPHSHDLTVKLFEQAGLRPTIAQVAEEKQTIVNLVAAELGLAIIPRWASRLAVPGVRYIPLAMPDAERLDLLPLAAAWLRGSRDAVRDELLAILRLRLRRYAAEA